jgi:hypothetical protein
VNDIVGKYKLGEGIGEYKFRKASVIGLASIHWPDKRNVIGRVLV